VWPEIEVMAQRYASSHAPNPGGIGGAAALPPVFDGEGHEHAPSPIDPAVTTLEHPMLLAPDRPWAPPGPASGPYEWTAGADRVPPAEAVVPLLPEPGLSAAPAPQPSARPVPHETLADLFWLSGVVPPEQMATDAPGAATGAPEPVIAPPVVVPPTRPEAANAEDTPEASMPARIMAVAPTAQDAPPPVQVIAYLVPRPFHPGAADLEAAAVAANDAALPATDPERQSPAVLPRREVIETAEGQEA